MEPKSDAPLRADAVRNRDRVLQVAREQLAAGDDSLQLNAIARLAGVGVGTVYRHFPNRQSLLEAVSSEPFQRLVTAAKTVTTNKDPLAALHSLLHYALEQTLATPGFATVLEAATDAEPRTAALKTEFDRALTKLLRQARQEGSVRKDVKPEDLRRLLSGTAHALRTGKVTPKHTKIYLNILLTGLQAPTPQPAP